jgi:hypothetical protein
MSLIKNKLSLHLPKLIKRIIVPKLAFLNKFKLLGKSCLSCHDGRVQMMSVLHTVTVLDTHPFCIPLERIVNDRYQSERAPSGERRSLRATSRSATLHGVRWPWRRHRVGHGVRL